LLLETGFAATHYLTNSDPLGGLPFLVTPEGTTGSFFEGQRSDRQRNELMANVYLPPLKWLGHHEFKFGAAADFVTLDRHLNRQPVFVESETQTLLRRLDFSVLPGAAVGHNTESGAYVQDRWSLSDRLLLETGVRFDEDTLLHNLSTSPRIAGTYMVGANTKLSAGAGLYHSNTNLELATRDLLGARTDIFFAPDGVTPVGQPITTRFIVPRDQLDTPRFFDWSAGIEQKLPFQFYVSANYQEKHGKRVLTYDPVDPSQLLGDFILTNDRSDRYRALELTLKRTFKNVYPIFLSYTRSTARTSASLDFAPDSIAFGRQFAGPLSWDTPNRFVGWGWVPFIKKFTLGYSLQMGDGLPIFAVNQTQQILPLADTIRFPRVFIATLAAERRFHVFGLYLALRGTLENITNQRNPTAVNNNIDSPNFLTFEGLDHRTFDLRIRFLGRSKPVSETPPPTTPGKP
jgi:hypothetical protein